MAVDEGDIRRADGVTTSWLSGINSIGHLSGLVDPPQAPRSVRSASGSVTPANDSLLDSFQAALDGGAGALPGVVPWNNPDYEGPNRQATVDASGSPLGSRFDFGAESNRFGLGLAPATGSRPMTPLQLLQELYNDDIDDATFRAIQEDLYVAGYFGSVEPDEIVWGNREDLSTFSAWQSFVGDVSTRAELGDTPNWWDILQAGVQQGALQGRSLEPVPEEEELEPGRVFQFSDPAALGQAIDAAAKRLLGRKVDADTKRAFVAAIHDLQRQAQQDAYAAREPGGADIELSNVDPGARAEQEILREYQDEAGAHAIGQQLQALSAMTGGFRG